MGICQVFPFEYVKKNSKVIIYGLGQYGVSYIEQVNATKWCEIVGVSDSDWAKKTQNYPFFTIKELAQIETDYVVIAIAAIKVVNQVYMQLIKCGVPEDKIISTLVRKKQNYKYIAEVKKTDKLQVMLQIRGGLGDCVVCLSAYEKIASMLYNADIDIQCRKDYGNVLYTGKNLLRSIIDGSEIFDAYGYDLILRLEHAIKVIRYDEARCAEIAPDLNKKVQWLLKTSKEMRNDIEDEAGRYAVQTRMAIIKGWDRYFMLGHGEVLSLNAGMVSINFVESYRKKYRKLRLNKYITLNHGTDRLEKHRMNQTKMWPVEYYERLLAMLRERYPEYEIIQLGGNGTEQIDGVDRCIKGESIELVKYILKDSTLHFDCEGGLVHLATALGTKCAVVFGPTPIEYYGYPQNINIVAEKCHNCMSLSEDWYVKCPRGEDKPECMYGIRPEMVFEKISEYLDRIVE